MTDSSPKTIAGPPLPGPTGSATDIARLLERCHEVLLYSEKALEYCPGYDQTKAMQEISHLLNDWPKVPAQRPPATDV